MSPRTWSQPADNPARHETDPMSMSNNPPRRKDLSPAMLKALRSFYVGRPWAHLSGRSQFGGSNETSYALHQRGLVNRLSDELTEDGLMECHALFGEERIYDYEARRILDVPPGEPMDGVAPVERGKGYETFRLRDVVEAKRAATEEARPPGP